MYQRYGVRNSRATAARVRVHALEKYLSAPGDESRELRLARAELETLAARYGENHPKVIAAREQVAVLAGK